MFQKFSICFLWSKNGREKDKEGTAMFDFSLHQKLYVQMWERRNFLRWPHRIIVLYNEKTLHRSLLLSVLGIQCTTMQIFIQRLTGFVPWNFIDYVVLVWTWSAVLPTPDSNKNFVSRLLFVCCLLQKTLREQFFLINNEIIKFPQFQLCLNRKQFQNRRIYGNLDGDDDEI